MNTLYFKAQWQKEFKEFERDQEYFKGKSELDKLRALAKERTLEEVERPDNTVYPRDVIGRRFQKDKAKYKIEMLGFPS